MRVFLHSQFKKRFKKIPPRIQRSFYERLHIFLNDRQDPRLNDHPVDAAYPGCRSINITGDYRMIYEIREEVIIIRLIGMHAELYR